MDNVRFEVLTAVTMKNDVFWDVTPCRNVGFLQELHGVTSQKTAFFMIDNVRTSQETRYVSTMSPAG
jgi:hypothetical protein